MTFARENYKMLVVDEAGWHPWRLKEGKGQGMKLLKSEKALVVEPHKLGVKSLSACATTKAFCAFRGE